MTRRRAEAPAAVRRDFRTNHRRLMRFLVRLLPPLLILVAWCSTGLS